MKLKRGTPLVTIYGKPNDRVRQKLFSESKLIASLLAGHGLPVPELTPLKDLTEKIEEQDAIIDEWCGLKPAKGPMGPSQYPEKEKKYCKDKTSH